MPDPTQTIYKLLGPIVCYGFAAVVAMWIVAFVTHHPAVDAPPLTTALILVSTLLTACIFAGGAAPPRRSWLVGAGTGLLAAAINLIIWLSYLAQPATPDAASTSTQLAPLAARQILGFLALGVVIGLIGGLLGTLLERIFAAKRKELIVPVGEPDWLARFGVVAACAAFPLLILGALVTSSGSAMSVPDWPTTYGANMFLYPIGLMTRPRIFIEHSHRLFGIFVGITTITLVLYTFIAREPRRSMRWWVVGLLLLVCLQGYLGGIRVRNQSVWLAFVHGVTAQIFFALLVGYAACLTPTFKSSLPRFITWRRAKIVLTAFLHLMVLQLIFGALYRHRGTPHALYAHIAFSLFIMVAALLGGLELRSMLKNRTGEEWARTRATMRTLGTAAFVCVCLQFALGWTTLYFVGLHRGKPDVPVGTEATIVPPRPLPELIFPTVHQANGALLLAIAMLGYVWMRRFWQSRRDITPVPAPPA